MVLVAKRVTRWPSTCLNRSLAPGCGRSLRAMIDGLENLPPINLEAELVGDTAGEPPLNPDIRVHQSSTGFVLETVINYFLGGDLSTRFILKVAVVVLIAAGWAWGAVTFTRKLSP